MVLPSSTSQLIKEDSSLTLDLLLSFQFRTNGGQNIELPTFLIEKTPGIQIEPRKKVVLYGLFGTGPLR